MNSEKTRNVGNHSSEMICLTIMWEGLDENWLLESAEYADNCA